MKLSASVRIVIFPHHPSLYGFLVVLWLILIQVTASPPADAAAACGCFASGSWKCFATSQFCFAQCGSNQQKFPSMAACRRRETTSRAVAQKEPPPPPKKTAPAVTASRVVKSKPSKSPASTSKVATPETTAIVVSVPSKADPLPAPKGAQPPAQKLPDRLLQTTEVASSQLTANPAGSKVDKILPPSPQSDVAGDPAKAAADEILASNAPTLPLVLQSPPKPRPPVYKLPDIGKRVALVIGNGAYLNAPKLPNPANDASDIATSLAQLRFKVRKAQNLDRMAFLQLISEFSREATGAEIALIFYAGHGLEIDGENYLIPVDAKLETDIQVRFEAVRLDDVLASLEGVAGLRMVMLDACRNNPFLRSMKVTLASRSVGRGFARIEPTIGTLVSYSAKEGTTASDGDGRNSPYTAAILAHIKQQGIEVNKFFRIVRDAVLANTGNTQEPYLYGSTSSEDVFLSPTPILVSIP